VAYLILQAGVAQHFFFAPGEYADRDAIVPRFEAVDLDADLLQAERPSSSLRSLITTPLFLTGGEAADRIRRNVPDDAPLGDSKAVSRAGKMMLGYMEVFEGANPPDRRGRFADVFRNYDDYVEGQVRYDWAGVAALVDRHQEQGRLTHPAAFDLIERNLDEQTKGRMERVDGEESRPRHQS
jgi:hypothetical protein